METNVLLFVLLTFGGVIVSLILMWWAILKLFSRLCGWPRLAARYRAPCEPPGQKLTGQSLGIGAIRFRNSMTLSIGSEGLYLSALLLRPPLLIPWREFGWGGETKIYGKPAIRLTVGHPEVGAITLWAGQYAAIRPHL